MSLCSSHLILTFHRLFPMLSLPQYINHHLNCNDKCLIYLLSCKVCGLQYVGSATDKLRLRWKNSKENDRKALRGEEHVQPELFEYFTS